MVGVALRRLLRSHPPGLGNLHALLPVDSKVHDHVNAWCTAFFLASGTTGDALDALSPLEFNTCTTRAKYQRTAAREGSGCKGMRKGEVVGFRAWGQCV